MQGVKVKESKIHGLGLFSNQVFNEGDIIGIAHVNNMPSGTIGKYHNHSDKPNSHSVSIGNKRYIAALRPLRKGEEITVDYRRQPELEQPEEFQNGAITTQEEVDAANNAMMKARLAYAYMHGNPAAQRMVVAPDQPYDFGNGMTGTHYMASMDEYAVPQIQDVNGQLMLGDYGPQSTEAIRFDGPSDAEYFAEHYKEVSPAFLNEKEKGGALLTKKLSKKRIFHPHAKYYKTGGESGCPEGYAFNPVTGECIEWDPEVWESEEQPTSYDPVGDVIYMNPNDRPEGMSDEEYQQMYQDQIEHEQLHRLQWINGGLKGDSGTPLRMPSTVDNQEYDGEHYYNRRGQEESYLHDMFNQDNPELAKFIPSDVIYDKVINPSMYDIPWTEEGEARGYEGALHNGMESLFPKRKKGGALLTKKVTCKKCGWKWDAADGGDDITTCHKCGGQGLVHAQGGGDISIPTLNQYPDGGQPRPVQGMAKPLAPLAIRQQQVKPLKNSPKVADQKKYKAVQDEVKAKATIQKASQQLDELQKDALPQYEQPLTPQDWVWTLPMAGGSAMKNAGTAIADGVGVLGTKAMPYLTGALETSLPGLGSVPGATVGNAIASGFATDAIVNRLPEGVTQLNNGQYLDATGNILTGLLDVAGAGMMSPLYQGAKSTASELGKFIGTEDGLLSNAYKVNPFAFRPNPEVYYRGIGKPGLDDALESGVFRQAGFDNKNYNNYKDVWYATGDRGFAKARDFAKDYIAEVPRSAFPETGDEFFGSALMPTRGTKKHIPINEGRILQKDWLRGYKEVPSELPGSPNTSFLNDLPYSEIPQINPQTGLLQVNNTTALSTVLPRTFKETYIPGYKSAEGLSEDMLPYLLPQEELMKRAPWRYLSKDQEIMNSFKSGARAQERPVEIPKEFNTQEDIMARALGKPLPEKVSRASLEPKIYYDIDGNVIDDPLKSGFDGNFLTRPLTPFTKNELTTLPNKNLKYRKIGNKAGLQDLINKGGAQAPAPMRMKSGLTADTPFFGMGKKPSEDYKGIFAVELKPDNSKYNWSSRVAGTDNYGVAPFDKVTGRSIKNVPLEDLNVYRKKFLSNNYKKLDPNNLEEGLKYAQAQVLAEQAYKWGIRGVTADQIFNDGNYRKQIQDAISNKLMTYKKNGGFMNSSTLNKFIR